MPAPLQQVSVIIPVFNGARYLSDAISSVLHQTHPPASVTVVDDGSTDGSAAIARSFGSVVTVIRQSNRGQAGAINAGIAHTTAEYVAFLDAHDLWEPEKTTRQLSSLAANPGASYSVTWVRNFLPPALEARRATLNPALFNEAPGFIASTLLARRRLFDEIGGFDERLRHANKTAWFLRARQRGALCEEVREVLVRRRLHGQNVSQQRAAHSLDEYLHLVKRSIDRRRGAEP
jgi:glycosyltransferase involved in cell wall biosynthesis